MGKSQRTKGAGYEREVAREITESLNLPGVEIKRRIGQARDGGNDLDVAIHVVEAKRRKTLTVVEGWLQQAEDAAVERERTQPRRAAHVPTVIARQDEGESLIVMRLSDFLEHYGDALRDHVIGDPYHRGDA